MSQTVLYRIAAIALIVGAVLTAGGNLLAPQDGARLAVASGLYYPVAIAVLLGGLVVMGGWPAAYLRQRAESGALGFAGFVAVWAAGVLLTVGFPLILLLIYPWIATMNVSEKVLNDGPDVFTIFFAFTSGVVSLGGVVFGIATSRARIFSRQLGILHRPRGGQLRARLPEPPGWWGHPHVMVVGDHRDLWRGRLHGGPRLVRNRTVPECGDKALK